MDYSRGGPRIIRRVGLASHDHGKGRVREGCVPPLNSHKRAEAFATNVYS